MNLSRRNGVLAPPEWWDLTAEERATLTNYCGPQHAMNGYLAMLIPNNLLGLELRDLCGVHDFQYHVYRHKHEKVFADQTFLRNMLFRIAEKGERVFERTILALIYFAAVRFFGGSAFKKARQ